MASRSGLIQSTGAERSASTGGSPAEVGGRRTGAGPGPGPPVQRDRREDPHLGCLAATVMPGSAFGPQPLVPRARRTTLRIRASCQSRIARAHSLAVTGRPLVAEHQQHRPGRVSNASQAAAARRSARPGAARPRREVAVAGLGAEGDRRGRSCGSLLTPTSLPVLGAREDAPMQRELRLDGVGFARYGLRGPWYRVDLSVPPGSSVSRAPTAPASRPCCACSPGSTPPPRAGSPAARARPTSPNASCPPCSFNVAAYLTHLGTVHASCRRRRVRPGSGWIAWGQRVRLHAAGPAVHKGSSQKVAVGSVAEPELLVLDEAWTGLTPTPGPSWNGRSPNGPPPAVPSSSSTTTRPLWPARPDAAYTVRDGTCTAVPNLAGAPAGPRVATAVRGPAGAGSPADVV